MRQSYFYAALNFVCVAAAFAQAGAAEGIAAAGGGQTALDPPTPIICPADSFVGVGAPAFGEDGAWQVFVSNDGWPGYDPASGVLLYEGFAGAAYPAEGGGIRGIHWWGISAAADNTGAVAECPLEPGHFRIGFWADEFYTRRPDYAAGELYGFDVTGAELTKRDTGHVYRTFNPDGSVAAAYTLWEWSCESPTPLREFAGWISIQNADECPFWWAASPGPPSGGDGIHVGEDQSAAPPAREDVNGELSWCLTSDQVGPFTGACCNTAVGGADGCRATTADDCVGVYDEWHGAQTCSQIACQAEVWACCEGSPASCSMYQFASCTGDWYRFYVCSETDPSYDPEAFGCAGNVIACPPVEPYCSTTCDSPAAFGRNLSGGYLYISWDRGPGDQRYVIDNFTGFVGEINRIKWWGNSTQVWDGPDCDFAQPAPFVIEFYHTSRTWPDYQNPSKVYDPIDATWTGTGYSWEGVPELGSIDCYTASLPTTYSPGTGLQWVSIASKTADCDYVWAPGPDGYPGQWFYDEGVITCDPCEWPRHRSFCLYTNIRTGACCDEAAGICEDAAEEPACLSQRGTFYLDQDCDQIPAPGCVAHPGACCDRLAGDCSVTASADCTGAGQAWLGVDSTCAECCVYTPPEAVPEGEPDCGDGYVDTYNGGCDAAAPAFEALAIGELLHGTFGTFHENPDGSGAELQDRDWYELAVSTPAVVRLHVKCEGVLPAAALYQPGPPESPCQTVLLSDGVASETCQDLTVSAAVEPGTYYAAIAPGSLGVPCGTPYTARWDELPGGACVIEGDPAEPCVIRSQGVCQALGGMWHAGVSCRCLDRVLGDTNCDGAVNTYDVDPFVLALVNPSAYLAAYPGCDRNCAADINHDGAVNAFDIDPFVRLLTGGGQ